MNEREKAGIGRNGWKWLKKAGYDWTWLKMAGMARNVWKWLDLAGNGWQ